MQPFVDNFPDYVYPLPDAPVWCVLKCNIPGYSRCCKEHAASGGSRSLGAIRTRSPYHLALVASVDRTLSTMDCFSLEPVLVHGSASEVAAAKSAGALTAEVAAAKSAGVLNLMVTEDPVIASQPHPHYPDYLWNDESTRTRPIVFEFVRRRSLRFAEHQIHVIEEGLGAAALSGAFRSDPVVRDLLANGSDLLLDHLAELADQLLLMRQSQKLHPMRLRGDRSVEFGDGGYLRLIYPVFSGQLPARARKQLLFGLTRRLEQLSAERQDCHHDNSPVEDIIDPSLAPCRLSSHDEQYLPRPEPYVMDRNRQRLGDPPLTRDLLDHASSSSSSSSQSSVAAQSKYWPHGGRHKLAMDDFPVRPLVQDLKARAKTMVQLHDTVAQQAYLHEEVRKFGRTATHLKDEATRVRSLYRWIPAEFLVESEPSGGEPVAVTIQSPIHQLPRTQENEPMYTMIAETFAEMAPLWRRNGILPGASAGSSTSTRLQVVVKAQSYRLTPGMSYQSRWHVEGLSEHIVTAGVVYCHCDRSLQGGDLQFCPSNVPGDEYDFALTEQIPCRTGTAVVWPNNLPHRMLPVQFDGPAGVARRTFLNFFIVDPKRPIKSTGNSVSYNELARLLRYYCRVVTGWPFPRELVDLVFSFCRPWNNVRLPWFGNQAREFREHARQMLSSAQNGWGYVHYGNCGETTFYPCKEVAHDEVREGKLFQKD